MPKSAKILIGIWIALAAVVFIFSAIYIFTPLKENQIQPQKEELQNPNSLPDDLADHIASKSDLIVVSNPKPLSVILSPLTVQGRARGFWFFEATFPIVLTDWDGRIIAEGYATAKDEWMTEEFVPFEGRLEFVRPENIGDFSKRGALIFRKDNPSGLPEHDDALEIPIFFE